MKQLVIMRHAKSSWSDPTLEDFDRPLNKRGLRDAPEMARRLASHGLKPDLVISSPARRAVATAHAVVPVLGGNLKDIAMEPGIYEAHTSELMGIIADIDDAHATVLMFGHNPGFTRLAEILGDTDIGNLPTSGYVWLSFDVERWTDVAARSGTVVRLDFPKRPAP